MAALAAALAIGPGARSAQGAEIWVWPVKGAVITSYRNVADPYAGGQHRGIDIAAEVGEPVVAATGGTVRFAGVAGSSGRTVSVRTADGRFDTSYLHLSGIEVRRGDHVVAGRRLGAVGTSGRRSSPAPHLHFGVREAGSRHSYRDPLDFLPPIAPPAGEGPRPVAPAPAPVRVVRAPVPRGAPAPARAPRRVRIPAGRRIRVPVSRPAPRAVLPGPRSLPAPAALPAPLSRPAPHHGVARHGATQPAPIPAAGPAPMPSSPQRPAPSGRARPSPAASEASGPDAGWALACMGLLLAAALLGRPGERPSSSRGGHHRVRSLLRPLLGRR